MLVFSRKQTDFFLLAAGRIVPETSRLGAVGQGRFLEIVDNALVKRPSSTLRQLRLFLLAMRFLPILRYGRTFAGLAGQQQDSFLKWLESCPIRLLRTGFWGVKTLVFMGYYGQEEISEAIAYRPSRMGNSVILNAEKRV